MAKVALLLLLQLLLLVGDSLQQDGPQDSCAALVHKIDAMQQNQCSMGAMLNLTADVATIKTKLAQQMKHAIHKGNLEKMKEAEESAKFESSLWLTNNLVTKELAALKTELQKTKSEVNQKFEKISIQTDAKVKNSLIKTEASFKELKQWISAEFALFKTQVKEAAEKNKICFDWKSKLGGLPLKRLITGVFFYFTESGKPHPAASEWCAAKGMRLARFESTEEMRTVAENAPKQDASYWVGASDVGHAPGQFWWSDDTNVQDDFWQKNQNQPNDFGAGKETCVNLYVYSGRNKLWDYSCSTTYFFICEVDAAFLHCL